MANVKEECGVAAVACKDSSNALPLIYKLLLNQQSRGQLSAGVTTFNSDRDRLLKRYRNLGSVNEVFRTSKPLRSKAIFNNYAGSKGIGHVRYATCGKNDRSYAQPFERMHGRVWRWFSYAFNGNIANNNLLRTELLQKEAYHLTRNTDTEVLMHLLARELNTKIKPDFKTVFRNISQKLDGAYSSVFINALGEIVLTRDPLGFKPLCYGFLNGDFIAASESNALLNLGIEKHYDVKPGHIVVVSGNSVEEIQYAPTNGTAHCMFEYVYFANVCSTIDGVPVYRTRTKLGEYLAEIEPLKIDNDFIVVAVPDTSKPAGDVMAYKLGIRTMEGVIRNRFVGRTFIEGSDKYGKVRNKFTVLKDVLKGKKVILVDDSIVRGSTSSNIVKYVKEVGGAKEVHIRIACPPIFAPCFYGIDMSTITELFAPKYITNPFDNENVKRGCAKLAADMGADSLLYLPIDLLVKGIGMPENKLCLGCLTGKYPTKWGNLLYKQAQTNHCNGNGKCGRAYD